MVSTNTLYVKIPVTNLNPDQTMGYAVLASGDLYGPLGTPAPLCRPLGGVDGLAFMQATYGPPTGYDVGWTERDAGVYTPRIYRGGWNLGWPGFYPDRTAAQENEFTTALEQEDILSSDLQEIARVVSPDVSNENAWGSKIRNLLMVACTEVESQMKGILKANGAMPTFKHFTTVDYVKLMAPLRLEEYTLKLARYRDYQDVVPFQGWTAANSTGSLAWYDAYIATKHDRELNFNRATLAHAISAAGALAILMAAQYGPPAIRPVGRSLFTFVSMPEWHHRERTYAPPPSGNWTPVIHKF